MMQRDEGQSQSSLSGDKSFPNTTIAISHSPSLSDYADHYTAAVVCVGVCLRGVRGYGGVVGGWYCRTWTWLQPALLLFTFSID